MKINSLISCLLTLIVFLFGCREEKQIKDQMEPKTTICYQAISQQDTAWLSIDTAKSEIIGLMNFNYGNIKKYEGQFKGKMYGDTLKGHYDFKVNKVDKWYRNPVAFLKRDGKLIMGIGNFTMIWGSAFFDQRPINYENGKFVFELGSCN